MNSKLLILALLLGAFRASAAGDPQVHLYVPDGQILGIPVKVYVASTNLDPGMKPRLQLAGYRARGRTNTTLLKEWEPFVIAPNQNWTEPGEGQKLAAQGTLLVFDLDSFELAFPKSTTRVTPLLSWQPPGLKAGEPRPVVVGPWVYLGDRGRAGMWTLLVVVLLAGLIAWMAWQRKKGILYLIAGEEGYMSLWRTQLVAWTLAVGSMVFLFGVIQLDVPRIPETLVVLMGMSVATGALSAIAGGPAPSAPAAGAAGATGMPAQTTVAPAATGAGGAVAGTPTAPVVPAVPAPAAAAAAGTTTASTPPAKPPADKPRWSDLISSSYGPKADKVVLSVPKAQMVFWTGVILVLFVVKSLLSGELWEVPWELVTLTGVSQAGYVGDKKLQQTGRTS